jgi:hypothetical protein
MFTIRLRQCAENLQSTNIRSGSILVPLISNNLEFIDLPGAEGLYEGLLGLLIVGDVLAGPSYLLTAQLFAEGIDVLRMELLNDTCHRPGSYDAVLHLGLLGTSISAEPPFDQLDIT